MNPRSSQTLIYLILDFRLRLERITLKHCVSQSILLNPNRPGDTTIKLDPVQRRFFDFFPGPRSREFGCFRSFNAACSCA